MAFTAAYDTNTIERKLELQERRGAAELCPIWTNERPQEEDLFLFDEELHAVTHYLVVDDYHRVGLNLWVPVGRLVEMLDPIFYNPGYRKVFIDADTGDTPYALRYEVSRLCTELVLAMEDRHIRQNLIVQAQKQVIKRRQVDGFAQEVKQLQLAGDRTALERAWLKEA